MSRERTKASHARPGLTERARGSSLFLVKSTRTAPLPQRLRALRPRALWRYLKDPRKPWGPKLAVVAAVAYLIFPLDLIPDVPLIGFLDDLGVLSAALAWLAQNALADADAKRGAPRASDPSTRSST